MARKRQDRPLDRLKKIALWQWGVIVILAGVMSSVVTGFMAPAGGTAAAQRGAMVGRAIAVLFFLLIGLGLIVLHFVRRK